MPPTEGSAPLQVMFSLSKQLARRGHQVVILDRKYLRSDLPRHEVAGVQIERLKVLQIPWTGMRGPIGFGVAELNAVLFALAVSSYLRKNGSKFDVIHLHLISIGLVVIALNRNLRKKTFYTCHLSQWSLPTGHVRFLERIHLQVDAFLMRRVRRVFAVNDAAKQSFVSHGRVAPERVSVLPHGVDSEFFHPGTDADVGIQAKYGIAGKTAVLFVGRLAKIKGVEQLLDAADALINRYGYADLVFLVVGPRAFPGVDEPISAEETRAFITGRGLSENVLFTGSLPLAEVRALYAACQVFVCPSHAEAGPLVTVEAMASGVPVVGTRVGGMPHQVVDGWNGFLVDPGDSHDLALRIKYLVDNPMERVRMGTNARAYAEQHFDWKNIATTLEQLYRGH
jgi:glycosyltransferase involved in cell wall biosynthesis